MTQPIPSNPAEPETEEAWVLCRVPTADIVYLRYTLEAYEGLCVPTTLPGRSGMVRLLTSRGLVGQLEDALEALSREVSLEILARGRGAPEEFDGAAA